MTSGRIHFPPNWVWGAGTAAYQIEGGVREGGRGFSIWDAFCRIPGKIAHGHTGDIACDHFHRVPEDIALMRELGLGAYRFSVAWPRIFPDGGGHPNAEGLDFYRRLVDELHSAGIEPYVTLYHWDLPETLQRWGGWENRDTALRFGEYAQTVAAALGQGVHHWFTINEPWAAAFLGHWQGVHAPGKRDLRVALAAAHNLLLAHGEGMSALRSEMEATDQAGIVLNLSPCFPADDSNADLEAAERIDGFTNRWFLDALYRGEYPEDMVRLYGDAMPGIAPGDMELISQPTDLLGINYYTRAVVAYDPTSHPLRARNVVPPGAKTTAMGWEVYPRGIHEVLTRVHEDYQPGPLLVTGNGAAYDDIVEDHHVDDPEREDYLHEHLLETFRAMDDGVPVQGYFVRSLLDNFEWAWGYEKRFGLIHVDFSTQERIIKRSGHWYASVTHDNGIDA